MSNFSSALQQAMADLSIQRQELAKKIGVVPSQVSAYANDLTPVGARAISRMCLALPMPHSARVLRGYLLDQIPEGSEAKVKIEVQAGGIGNSRLLPEMDDELATAIKYVIGRALKEQMFRALVVDLYQVTAGNLDDSANPIPLPGPEPFEEAVAEFRDMPLIGTVPAGRPSDNPQQPESYVQVPVGKYPDDAFGLRVQGDSMIGKNIFDGDIVVLHKREAKNGDVVVALIDGETTLKTLVSKNGKCKLRSENPKHRNPVLTDQSAIQAVMIDKL